MMKSKRAIAVALASFGLLAAADLPTDLQSAPVALDNAEPVAFTLEAEDIEFTAPLSGDDMLTGIPATEVAEAEADAAALAAGFGDDISLHTLVNNVRDYGTPELDKDMKCLASAIYNEARGEPLEGQLAVAQVVLNRANDHRWPDSICEVVFQRYQFSFTFDGKPDYPAPNRLWKQAEAIAIVAATENWDDVTDEAVFFHARYVSPRWRKSFQRTANIGQHIFYR